VGGLGSFSHPLGKASIGAFRYFSSGMAEWAEMPKMKKITSISVLVVIYPKYRSWHYIMHGISVFGSV